MIKISKIFLLLLCAAIKSAAFVPSVSRKQQALTRRHVFAPLPREDAYSWFVPLDWAGQKQVVGSKQEEAQKQEQAYQEQLEATAVAVQEIEDTQKDEPSSNLSLGLGLAQTLMLMGLAAVAFIAPTPVVESPTETAVMQTVTTTQVVMDESQLVKQQEETAPAVTSVVTPAESTSLLDAPQSVLPTPEDESAELAPEAAPVAPTVLSLSITAPSSDINLLAKESLKMDAPSASTAEQAFEDSELSVVPTQETTPAATTQSTVLQAPSLSTATKTTVMPKTETANYNEYQAELDDMGLTWII